MKVLYFIVCIILLVRIMVDGKCLLKQRCAIDHNYQNTLIDGQSIFTRDFGGCEKLCDTMVKIFCF